MCRPILRDADENNDHRRAQSTVVGREFLERLANDLLVVPRPSEIPPSERKSQLSCPERSRGGHELLGRRRRQEERDSLLQELRHQRIPGYVQRSAVLPVHQTITYHI